MCQSQLVVELGIETQVCLTQELVLLIIILYYLLVAKILSKWFLKVREVVKMKITCIPEVSL